MQRAYHARGLGFLPRAVFIITIGLITAALSYQAVATDVYTDPVGFITVTATGTNGIKNGAVFTFWGLGMAQLPVQRGIIGSVSGKQLKDLNGNWVTNQYNGAAGAYEIEITSGSNAGLVDVVSNTAPPNILNTLFDDSSMISSGNTYLVRPSWTLNAIFGASNSAGLFGGNNNTVADNVEVWNPTAQSYASGTYYYKTNSGSGGSGWRSTLSTSANAGTNGLFIDQGLVIIRKQPASTNVLLVGAVKLGQTLSPITKAPGLTQPGNPYAASFKLRDSGLYTTNDLTGLHGGNNNTVADNVLIWSVAAQSYASGTYYYKTNSGSGGSGWRSTLSTSADVGNTNITLGGMIVINRRITNQFNWFMQQPYVNP